MLDSSGRKESNLGTRPTSPCLALVQFIRGIMGAIDRRPVTPALQSTPTPPSPRRSPLRHSYGGGSSGGNKRSSARLEPAAFWTGLLEAGKGGEGGIFQDSAHRHPLYHLLPLYSGRLRKLARPRESTALVHPDCPMHARSCGNTSRNPRPPFIQFGIPEKF